MSQLELNKLAYDNDVKFALDIDATTQVDFTNSEKAFRATEKLVVFLVNTFYNKYGGNREDLLSEAHWHWVRAWNTFDPKRGKFHKRVQFMVWYGLMTTFYKEQKINKKTPIGKFKDRVEYIGDAYIPTIKEKFGFNSKKVKELIDIIIDDRLDLLKCAGIRKNIQEVRQSFIEFLRSIGWSYEQIAEVIQEIQEHIS